MDNGDLNEQIEIMMTLMSLDPNLWEDKRTFAEALHEMAGADRPEKVWSPEYLSGVMNWSKTGGGTPPSKLFKQAVAKMGAHIDGVPKDVARGKSVTVLAVDAQLEDGTLILGGETRRCLNPACRLKFLPRAWNQKYHSDACKEAHYKMEREHAKKS